MPAGHTKLKGCPQWLNAQQIGTDNEAFGRLISIFDGGVPQMGCNIEPIEFCPWCGVRLRPLTEDKVPRV